MAEQRLVDAVASGVGQRPGNVDARDFGAAGRRDGRADRELLPLTLPSPRVKPAG
jgi:hypothetical protein